MTDESLEMKGRSEPSRYTSPGDLFSDRPHLCLMESFWDTDERVATTCYFIVDAASGEVARHIESLQVYTDEQYRARPIECGFTEVEFFPSLIGRVDEV
jgi:hypothetical protein